MSETISKARALRHDPTPAEKRLWEKIRNSQLGIKFRRQVPVGPYIADFLCLKPKLIVEVDGNDHAESETDRARTRYLEDLGFAVIRFWNNDVLQNIEGTVETLRQHIDFMK